MNFSNIEEKIVEPFYRYVHLSRVNISDVFLIKWKGGTKVLAKYDTCYESDNDLDLDDPEYEDFIEIVISIESLISFNNKDKLEKKWLQKGHLIGINYHNFPDEIYNSRRELISKREN